MSTIFSTGVYLNTSYVKVQYREKGGTKQWITDLNTSYVKVQFKYSSISNISFNLNTSYVKVQWRRKWVEEY